MLCDSDHLGRTMYTAAYLYVNIAVMEQGGCINVYVTAL